MIVIVIVTEGKQSQLLVFGLGLEFDKKSDRNVNISNKALGAWGYLTRDLTRAPFIYCIVDGILLLILMR